MEFCRLTFLILGYLFNPCVIYALSAPSAVNVSKRNCLRLDE